MSIRTVPKPCPKCGGIPRTVTTVVGTMYIVCLGHLETKGCETEDEAIALWNAEKYEEQYSKQP